MRNLVIDATSPDYLTMDAVRANKSTKRYISKNDLYVKDSSDLSGFFLSSSFVLSFGALAFAAYVVLEVGTKIING